MPADSQLSRRPIRWFAEEQSRLLARFLQASVIGPDHLLASGTKDQAGGHVRALATSPKAIKGDVYTSPTLSAPVLSTLPQGIFKEALACPPASLHNYKCNFDHFPTNNRRRL